VNFYTGNSNEAMFQKYLIVITSLTFLSLLLVITVNITVDPYGVFKTKLLPIEVEPVQAYRAADQLMHNPEDFNGVMLGSSAVGFTPPTLLNTKIPGAKFFNFWSSSATQYENLQHLKFAIKTLPKIKYVYLQVDPILNMTAYKHEKNHQRRLHPLVSGERFVDFFWDFATVLPWERLNKKIRVNLGEAYTGPVLHYKEGAYVSADYQEEQISHNPEKYYREESRFRIEVYEKRTVRNEVGIKNIQAIKEIKKLCDDQGIKLYVLVRPEHPKSLDRVVTNEYIEFIRQLSSVTEFWSFGGYTKYNLDNYYWYEPGHFRPLLSDKLAQVIFDYQVKEDSENFGVQVKKVNLESYIDHLEYSFQKRDSIRFEPVDVMGPD